MAYDTHEMTGHNTAHGRANQHQYAKLSRRQVTLLGAAAILATTAGRRAYALDVAELTQAEAAQGLRQALEQGALAAVGLLGKKDGFLANERVRIGLPGNLEEAGKLLSRFGQNKRVEDLITGMNRAAEQAVPQARDLLLNAVRSMDVVDASNILTGGEHSVTDFFASKTREPLHTQFLPIVTNVTRDIDLASKYNRFADKAARFGLVRKQDASVEQYVTGKALDGLYTIIGEQEVALRRNPAGAATDVLRRVFGTL